MAINCVEFEAQTFSGKPDENKRRKNDALRKLNIWVNDNPSLKIINIEAIEGIQGNFMDGNSYTFLGYRIYYFE